MDNNPPIEARNYANSVHRVQLTGNMEQLKECLLNDNVAGFKQLDRFPPHEINDLGENLMILYASIPTFFNDELVFNNILQRRNGFKLRRDWHRVFQ